MAATMARCLWRIEGIESSILSAFEILAQQGHSAGRKRGLTAFPASSLRSERLRSHMICFGSGPAVGPAKTSKKRTAPEESGAAFVYSDSLFRPLGGFLHKA
jgi:hypothetical protein